MLHPYPNLDLTFKLYYSHCLRLFGSCRQDNEEKIYVDQLRERHRFLTKHNYRPKFLYKEVDLKITEMIFNYVITI